MIVHWIRGSPSPIKMGKKGGKNADMNSSNKTVFCIDHDSNRDLTDPATDSMPNVLIIILIIILIVIMI